MIYVGERHDRYADHLAQLSIIEAVHRRAPALAIGLEQFQTPFQPALDDYVAGKIGIDALLERSEYFTRWRFDPRLYLPILEFARENAVPMVALNAPTETTDAVSRQGLDAVTGALGEVEPAPPAYRERLRAVFEEHVVRGAGSGDFE
ncbi:MAG: iron-regulated protein, partial [Actinobacteria bacterium]|nr:ChaN family lipoprotein [Actinomycetota bacterium]NIS31847.1 ChaN family lipoprotein [Actinomycetota bacterium]NIU70224.1 ChaN family lipoprotein [Actinomycetota bacterium]NIW32110.1 iron-regulated protein [Actinomycetota bacterium]NIX24342.1 iron-regulated protein [Actinomycetota bacterium]